MVTRSPILRLMVFLLAFAMPVAVFAAKEKKNEPVGKGSGGGGSIQWLTTVSGHDRIVLSVVAPDGEVYTKTFSAGKNPSFSLQDLPGKADDGEYTYELTVMPKISAGLAKQLNTARAAGDDKKARDLMRANGLNASVAQSGAFSVQGGSIVNPDLEEADANDGAIGRTPTTDAVNGGRTTPSRPGFTPAVEDQVIPDDLIVQGSACIGLDCVNNESFGFDTIRLKENNTRIKFEDTSVGSFPTTDWQLTANDSASGGASKFSIENITNSTVPFTVLAGSTNTNAIFVDSTGRVGFRTSTPVLDLHVSTSNTPALRLEQTSAGGFTAQTWDVGGNEANFFVRDVTSGSRLPFRIRPGAPTSAIDIAADGMVGVGTASPDNKIDLVIGTRSGTHNATDRPFYVTGELGQASNGAEVMHNNGTSGVGIGFGGVYTRGVGVANLNFSIMPQGTGNVGVNILVPTSKLHVNGGDIRVTGGSFIDDGVTLNAPDYVFDESYKLMPLIELAAFIRENNHLPNVPSAKDIKANGLNMSHFQMKLLEKVEELTLYTLTQSEQIGTLKSQNDELQKRLIALEGQLSKTQ